MKNIKSLVPDIRSLLISEGQHVEEKVREFGSQLGSALASRLANEAKEPALRLSNLGKPGRQLWYSIQRPHLSEPLPPSARFKFLYGDLLEELVLYLAEAAGHKVEDRQLEVNIDGVRGHIDAVIDGELVDVKSASSFSFKKFVAGFGLDDDPFGYIAQLGGYAYALERRRAYWLPVDKTLGHLALTPLPKTNIDYKGLVDEKRRILDFPQPPARCFPDEPETYYRKATGNRKLGLNCSYCSFKASCWPGLRVFLNNGKPTFYTHVVNPKGDEIKLSEVPE